MNRPGTWLRPSGGAADPASSRKGSMFMTHRSRSTGSGWVLFWGCLFVALVCCVSSGFAGTVSVTYRYDPAGRLLSADYGAAGKVTYTYDRAGNLLSATVTAAQAQSDEADEDGSAIAKVPDAAPPDALTLAARRPEEAR